MPVSATSLLHGEVQTGKKTCAGGLVSTVEGVTDLELRQFKQGNPARSQHPQLKFKSHGRHLDGKTPSYSAAADLRPGLAQVALELRRRGAEYPLEANGHRPRGERHVQPPATGGQIASSSASFKRWRIRSAGGM